MASRSMNRLPILSNGDVEIWLTRRTEDRLLLHSVVLALHSSWFKASLAERWAKARPGDGGPKKWSYHLEFDSDQTAMLMKRHAPPAAANLLSNDPLAIYINYEGSAVEAHTTVPSSAVAASSSDRFPRIGTGAEDLSEADDAGNQCSVRDTWVVAYRCLFNTMFHEPLGISLDNGPLRALESLHILATVGDIYDASRVLRPQVENFLHQNFLAFKPYLFPQARIVLDIAVKIRIDWLCKDILCYLAGDEGRDDRQIQVELEPEMATLVLSQRDILRRMIQDIDLKLLTFNTIKSTWRQALAAVTSACFRQFVAQRITQGHKGKWRFYAKTYRRLATEVGKVDSFSVFQGFTEIDSSLFKMLNERAVLRIQPLFANHLSRPEYYSTDAKNGKNGENLERGFTCIKVSDEDLPWNRP